MRRAVRSLVLAVPTFLFAAAGARADIQTSLTFTTPSTIVAGGSVTVDVGITFIPLPATTGIPTFIDEPTHNQVTSCATDLNACAELQFNTTASILSPGPPILAAVLVVRPRRLVPKRLDQAAHQPIELW